MLRCARSTAGSARPPPSRALPAAKSARSNDLHWRSLAAMIIPLPRGRSPRATANSCTLLWRAVLRRYNCARWVQVPCLETDTMPRSYRRSALFVAFLSASAFFSAAHAQDERSLTDPTGWYWYYNVTPETLTNVYNNTGSRIIDLEVVDTSPLLFTAALVV